MNPYFQNDLILPYSNNRNYHNEEQSYYNNYPTEISNNFNQNNYLVNSMLNNRLSKLNYEKEILNGIHNPYNPPTPYINKSYNNYSSLANFGQNIITSPHYLVDLTIPIPHPLEIPKMCSPVQPPRYASGGPLNGKHCCHKNNALDILLLLTQIGEIPPKKKTPPKESKSSTPKKRRRKLEVKRK